MKGIVLVGGIGTRLRPFTYTESKPLLPIANKRMLQYSLEHLRDIGIKEIAIVAGSAIKETEEFFGDGKKLGVQITYIFQKEPKGISHAIYLTKKFVNNEKFIVFLGDNILENRISEHKKRFESENQDAMILLYDVKNPSQFGIAEVKNKEIIKIVEKPKNPNSNHAVIGVYFLTSKIFDIIKDLKPSLRGELEITDALQLSIKNNHKVIFDFISGWWNDAGTIEGLLETNKLVLNSNLVKINSLEYIDKMEKNGKKSNISKDSIIIEPVIIGNNCNIEQAKIGPNVSIGDGCILKKCQISDSIVMNNCKIDSDAKFSNSIISNYAEIINKKIN